MESTLTASMFPKTPYFAPPPPPAQHKIKIIPALPIHQKANLAKKIDSQLNIPITPVDIAAKAGSITTADVGRWH